MATGILKRYNPDTSQWEPVPTAGIAKSVADTLYAGKAATEAAIARTDPGVPLTQSMSLRGGPTMPYVAPSAMVLPEDFGGAAISNGSTDATQAILDAVAAAKVAGVGYTGSPVGLLYGRYLISAPIVLPRTGLSPTTIVWLVGHNPRSSMLIGSGDFPAGRGMIEWDATTTRAWMQRIENLHIILPSVDGTMAIRHTRTTPGTAANANAEWLQLDLENVLLVGSNTYHERLIYLEVGNRYGTMRNVFGDPTRGNNPIYETALIETGDGGYTDWGHVGADTIGLGYCVMENISPMVRNGGYSRIFAGRMYGGVWDGGFCNGGMSPGNAQSGLHLVNSSMTTFRSLHFEGLAEREQVRIDHAMYHTFELCGIAGPDPQPPDWAPSTAYSVGDTVVDSSLRGIDLPDSKAVWRCTTAGTSGATEPTWPASGTVADGSVVWTHDGDAVGNGIVLADAHHIRWRGRAVTPGTVPFSRKLVAAITIDADSSDNVFADFDVVIGPGDDPADEFQIDAGPGKHNLIYGYAVKGGTSSATWAPYVVGWHPGYPDIVRPPVTVTDATYDADIADHIIEVNTGGTAIDVRLPPAAGIAGKEYIVRKIDAFGATVTINPNGAEVIGEGGAYTYPLRKFGETVIVVSDGAKWIVTSAHVTYQGTSPTSLTAANASAIDATWDATEQAVLENVRTRVNELETKLKNLSRLT